MVAAAWCAPASASQTLTRQHISFHADQPCAAACTGWLENATGMEAAKACGVPSPASSHDDIVVVAPNEADVLVVEILPKVDWDLYVCEVGDTANHNGVPEEKIAERTLYGPCEGLIGPGDPTGLGCHEKYVLDVEPGTSYLLRGYNVADPADCPGIVEFMRI